MSATLGTRIIDGDGHIMEDNAAIIAHMEGALPRDRGAQGNLLSALGSSSCGASRRNTAATGPTPAGRTERLARVSRRRRHRLDRHVSDSRALLWQDREPRLRGGDLQGLQRLDDRHLYKIQSALQRHGDYSDAGPGRSRQGAAPRGHRTRHAWGDDAVQWARSAFGRKTVLAGLRRGQQAGSAASPCMAGRTTASAWTI